MRFTRSYSLFTGIVAAGILICVVFAAAPSAGAATVAEETQLAALSQALRSLWSLLGSLQMRTSGRYLAQTSSSSCSASLVSLLGADCHYMYADSAGAAVYCDGPMTKSAKAGDATATTGCSSGSSSTSTYPSTYPSSTSCSTGTQSSCTADASCMWITAQNSVAYCDIKSTYSGDATSCPGFAGSQWDSAGKRYCKLNKVTACQYAYPDYMDTNTYSVSNCPSTSTQTTTTTTTTTTTGTAPTSGGLTATVSGSDIVLSWTDFYTSEDEYRVDRKIGAGAWVQTGTTPYLAGGSGTYRDVAPPSGTYDYRVRPCTHAGGCTGESNTARATIGGTSTSTTAPTTATPAPVISNLWATNVTSNSATIGWTTDILANSKVEYGIGAVTQSVSNSSFVTNHTISITGLIASTTYTYDAISENTDYYRTIFSNQKFSTLAAGGGGGYALNAPTGLSARLEANGVDVMLTWTDNSYEETYTVERRRSQEAWVAITSLPSQAGTGSYLDRSILAGSYGSYEYRVKACGGGTCSPESNIAYVTVTGSTSSSSCDAGLTTLLGTNCHYMYNDASGNAIYCNGEMTKSAKRGDTATTAGCSTSSIGGTAQCADGKDNDGDGLTDYPQDTSCYSKEDNDEWYPVSGQTGTTTPSGVPTAPTGLSAVQSGPDVQLSWDDLATNEDSYKVEWYNGTDWIVMRTTGSVYGGRGSAADYAPSSQRTHQYRVKACNASGCSVASNVASVFVSGTTGSNCPAGYHFMAPLGGTGLGTGSGYCMSDASPTVCQPLSGGASYTCPAEQMGTTTIAVAPALWSLSPWSGPVGTKVMITGSGFTPTGNRINFGSGVVMDIASSDGKTLTFTAPSDQVPLCAITEPRCLLPAPYNPVKPGTYWISVINTNGASGGLSFSVTEAVDAIFSVNPLGRTSPKNASVNVDIGARITVQFNREFDPASTLKEFFRLTKTAAPDVRVPGSFALFSDGFEFVPSGELESNTRYTYTIFPSLRDRYGNYLVASHSAAFTTSGSTRGSGVISGTVTDATGAPVPGTYIYVFVPQTVYRPTGDSYSYQNYFSRNTKTDAQGAFQISMPPGSYMVEVYPPYGRTDLARVPPREVSVAAGETKTITFTLGSTAKIITGTVLFATGVPVTDAEVSAYATETRQWASMATDAVGAYTLKVGAGNWLVGIHPRQSGGVNWNWNGKPQGVTFVHDGKEETITRNFTVAASNAAVAVIAVDDTGNPVPSAGIVADGHSAAFQDAYAGAPPEFRITGSDGKARFSLPPGAYYIRSYASSDRGYVNPGEQPVILAAGDAKEIKIVFKKKQAAGLLAVSGTARLEGGISTDAFIWAWSEKGGFVSTRADQQGRFSFGVSPNERWHVGAGKEYKGLPYKSPELAVDVKQQPVTIELLLAQQSLVPLPSTVSVSSAAAQQVVAQATDGAQLTLPPSAAASTGDVKVEIKPTIEAPSQAGTDVVSTVYDVTIRDASGNAVTKLAEEAEIIIPYSEADLKAQGVSEDAIVPSYYDEKAGTWVSMDTCTIDKERNVAVCKVDHLTRFAITARADTAAPDAPAGASVAASGSGVVTLTWKNPAKDFAYAKVYRSSKAGELGVVRAAAVRAAAFADREGLADGALYYYTVRAVDPAGNESANVVQLRVAAKGTSGAGAGKVFISVGGGITRGLQRGMRGDDVKMMQQRLVADGLLAAGNDTGFFGPATEAALKKFQTQNGLEAVGSAGPKTRVLLNK